MIVPSIDLRGGHSVQLVGGETQALDAGDPRPLAETFGRVGEVAVIDLDAALGTGNNGSTIRELLALAACRVGGGIRDVATAQAWLDAGAHKVILGTAARAEILRELPKERVVAALDARHGEVVVEGWRKKTGARIEARMAELDGLVGGYLVTFVEREGRLGGIDLAEVERVVRAARGTPVTVAGGVATLEELAAIDRMGADAQVGMALYTKKIDLADAFSAPLSSDRADGLWPTLVVDERGTLLGLAWSDRESLRTAIHQGVGAYHSRRRGLWIKGATSGATQELISVAIDCDRDALRFRVRQREAFCHTGTRTCFGEDAGIGALARLTRERTSAAPPGSYTRRLLDDPTLLGAKLREEAAELARASTRDEVLQEAADVLYFTLVKLARHGVELGEVEGELDRRGLKVSRRPGDAKPSDTESRP